MSSTLEEFRATFDLPRLNLAENDHWIWSLRPKQPTLGCGILSMKLFTTRLCDAPVEAGQSHIEMVKIIEATLSSCFAYSKINYLMLMMVDNHAHYHVIPRYDCERAFGGKVWVDEAWPVAPNLGANQMDGDPALLSLRDHLRSNSSF